MNLDNMEEIGSGGYGTVYKGHNDYINMDFAYKIFSPCFLLPEKEDEWKRRFFREAKMLYRINNKNVVKIYDVGMNDGKPFIKMEYIKGMNLRKYCDNVGVLSFKQSLPIIIDILEGLNAAHNNGIIHRDLKPENIMYSKEENRFKIIDFGVSAYLDYFDYSIITQVGETPAGGDFIDPQLKSNPQLIDERSDIYSLGCIWYYLLCHRSPVGSNIEEMLIKTNPELSTKEIELIFKCFKYEIGERYFSCKELLSIINSTYFNILEPIYSGLTYSEKVKYIENLLIRCLNRNDENYVNNLVNINENLLEKLLSSVIEDYDDYSFKSFISIGETLYTAIGFNYDNEDRFGDLIIDYNYYDYLPTEEDVNDIFFKAKQKERFYKESTERNCHTKIYIVAKSDILYEIKDYYMINHYAPGIYLLEEKELVFIAGGVG